MPARSSDEVSVMKSPVRLPALLVLSVAFFAASLCACYAPKVKPKDPATETAMNIRLAESYFGAGKINEALGILEKAAASQPANAALRNYYGQLCFLAGRHAEAEQAFVKALELDPHLTDARNNLGALYDATGRKDEAEQQFLTVLADLAYASPEKAHLNLGILYLSEGRQDEAISHLRQAVEINPKFWRGHFELASALDKAGRLDEAAREYEVAAPDYKGNAEYHYRIGLAYMKLDQPSKAREHFILCQELSPGSESASRAYDLLKMLP
jgi:Flp pilus assembly protein TadD